MTAKAKSTSKIHLADDTVLLHCIGRGKLIPSISPFVLKLETFLRLYNIPYEIDTKKPTGPSGKTPWIILNGVDMTDSQLIVEFLAKKFNKVTWGDATAEQKALARSLRVMLEEHFFWGMVRWRFVEGVGKFQDQANVSNFRLRAIKLIAPGRVKKILDAQGLGRHPYETIVKMVGEDLRNVSTILGDKKFILGDEPCEVDCALFGIIAQVVFSAPTSPFENIVLQELPNLKEYCTRMKERVWPDWDECLFKK